MKKMGGKQRVRKDEETGKNAWASNKSQRNGKQCRKTMTENEKKIVGTLLKSNSQDLLPLLN